METKDQIPELKGVLMEVSHCKDFKISSNLEVFGINSGNFLTHIGSYPYARPIKEVKECWVNVGYFNESIWVSSPYNTEKDAKYYSELQDGYIKTIKIDNQKE